MDLIELHCKMCYDGWQNNAGVKLVDTLHNCTAEGSAMNVEFAFQDPTPANATAGSGTIAETSCINLNILSWFTRQLQAQQKAR